MKKFTAILFILLGVTTVFAQQRDTTTIRINDTDITIITDDDQFEEELVVYDEDTLTTAQYDSIQVLLRNRLKELKADLYTLKPKVNSSDKTVQADAYKELDIMQDRLDVIEDDYYEFYGHLDPIFEEEIDLVDEEISALKGQTKYAHRYTRLRNTKTRWMMLDLGLSTYDTRSNVLLEGDINPLEQDLWQSRSVTIHFFQTRHNLVKHHLNIVYGLGFESNGYAFDNNIRMEEDDAKVVFVYDPEADYCKSRLRANYIQVPLFFNYESNPVRKRHSFRVNAGAYLNILTNANYKVKDNDRKDKVKDRFHLRNYEPGINVEVGYGSFNLYCRYGLRDLFEKAPANGGYELTPLRFGIKLIPF